MSLAVGGVSSLGESSLRPSVGATVDLGDTMVARRVWRIPTEIRVYGQFCIETIHGRLKRKREFNSLSFSYIFPLYLLNRKTKAENQMSK